VVNLAQRKHGGSKSGSNVLTVTTIDISKRNLLSPRFIGIGHLYLAMNYLRVI